MKYGERTKLNNCECKKEEWTKNQDKSLEPKIQNDLNSYH